MNLIKRIDLIRREDDADPNKKEYVGSNAFVLKVNGKVYVTSKWFYSIRETIEAAHECFPHIKFQEELMDDEVTAAIIRKVKRMEEICQTAERFS